MAVRAQRDYYTMPAAGQVLRARVDALSEAIPKGSVVLDMGCNDGSISNALLENGTISKSHGFDLENILAHSHPGMEFHVADIKSFDLSGLPDADGVMILNLLHHIVGFTKERAKEVIDYLIERYAFVVIDMGSFTEKGDWYWRRAYDKHWKSDAEMWRFLFSKAQWRFKLLRYPTQGKGERTLWKLYKEPYAIDGLEQIDAYKRPPEAWAPAKKLIPLSEVGSSKIVPTVDFALARSSKGDKFWLKKYSSHSRQARVELEMKLAQHAVREIEAVNAMIPCDLRASCPVSVLPDGGLAFLFEPDLFGGLIVHFQDWPEFFSNQQCRAGGVLATRRIEIMTQLPRLMLVNACDFQLCSTWDGLTALDFEPNNWLIRVRVNNGPAGLADMPPASRPGSNAAFAAKLAEIDIALERTKAEIRELRQALLKPPG